MSELLDVQFYEDDDRETHFRKLRILQDEIVRLSQAVAQMPNIEDPGTLNLRNTTLVAATGASAGFLDITVNDQPLRVPVYLPS